MPSAMTINIPAPKYQSEHIVTWQNAAEIVKQLKRAELASRRTSRTLAPAFKTRNQLLTAARVWHFLRTYITYDAEPRHNQTAKEISRFLADRIGDCKHYGTTAVGILNACDIPAWFSFVGQDAAVRKPNHAYCTALINNQLVIIDPCRERFNSECRYFYKWDVVPH